MPDGPDGTAARPCGPGKDEGYSYGAPASPKLRNTVNKSALWEAFSSRNGDPSPASPHTNVVAECIMFWRHAVAAAKLKPSIATIPMVLLLVVVGLGLFGVLTAGRMQADATKDSVTMIGLNVAASVSLKFIEAAAPTVSLTAAVRLFPNMDQWADVFPTIAQNLMDQVPSSLIAIAPLGFLDFIWPPDPPQLGLDLFSLPERRAVALRVVELGNLTMTGYQTLLGGDIGVVLRRPIFFDNVNENETWGYNKHNQTGATNCSICYDPVTRRKFWGFIAVLVSLTQYDSLIAQLHNQGLNYRVTEPIPTGGEYLITNNTNGWHSEPVQVRVELPNTYWNLYLEPADGWTPTWVRPLIALVILLAFLLACLLFFSLYTRQRHLQLLQTMLPKKVIKCLHSGQGFCESFPSVTILFSDIVSYTNMAAELKPIEVCQLLNDIFSQFDDLVEKHSLYKVETIGDAFMAVGGCPDQEDPVVVAARVARMAQDMIRCTAAFSSPQGQSLRIRLGIHTGPIVAAVVGRKMPHYALFGDTVNTASRMESHGLPMKIHVSSDTAQLLMHNCEFNLMPRGTVSIKGKGPMTTYFLDPGTDISTHFGETGISDTYRLSSGNVSVDDSQTCAAPPRAGSFCKINSGRNLKSPLGRGSFTDKDRDASPTVVGNTHIHAPQEAVIRGAQGQQAAVPVVLATCDAQAEPAALP